VKRYYNTWEHPGVGDDSTVVLGFTLRPADIIDEAAVSSPHLHRANRTRSAAPIIDTDLEPEELRGLVDEMRGGKLGLTQTGRKAKRLLGGTLAYPFLYEHLRLTEEAIATFRHPDLKHPFAGRDDALTRIVGSTCRHLACHEGMTPEVVLALVYPLLEDLTASAREGDGEWVTLGTSMVERFWQRENDRIATEDSASEIAVEEIGTDGTDTGNAALFRQLCEGNLVYCPEVKCWRLWDESRWITDHGGAMALGMTVVVSEALSKKIDDLTKAIERARAAGDEDGAAYIGRIFKEAKRAYQRAASGGGRRELLNLAAADSAMQVSAEQFDSQPHLVVFKNGTYDLRADEFCEARRDDYLSQSTNVEYDPTATCPLFESFVAGIFPDTNVRSFWQVLLGLVLTGEHLEQFFAFLYGGGSNGKSTMLAVLHDVLGDYAKTAARGLFKASRNENSTKDYGFIDAKGARLLTSVEVSTSSATDEETLKALTGGDPVKGRHPYGRPEEFQPTFSLFIAANEKPRVRDQSEGYWRRVLLIPFEASFKGKAAVKDMRARLRAEAPGILNYMIGGLRRYRVEGLNPPEVVRLATEEYRRESNLHEQFVSECCELDPASSIPASRLWAAWRDWAQQARVAFGSQTALGRAMTEQGIEKVKSSGTYRYQGIRIRRQFNVQQGA